MAPMVRMPVATLRIWEQRFQLTPREVAASGYQRYPAAEVQRIALLKQVSDFRHEIATMAALDMEQLREVAVTHVSTLAGSASARARGRKGGRPFKMTPAKLRLAMAAMGQAETKVADLCTELGITRQTLYRHVSPKGELRPDGMKLLAPEPRC